MIHLDYRSAKPIYLQIMDGLREQILTGVLQPEEKLPSVRELAGNLAINPNTIQRSYRQLEAEGWIVTVPGKGCFVCATDSGKEKETKKWLTAFDEATAMLRSLGVSEEMLEKRLKGGNQRA